MRSEDVSFAIVGGIVLSTSFRAYRERHCHVIQNYAELVVPFQSMADSWQAMNPHPPGRYRSYPHQQADGHKPGEQQSRLVHHRKYMSLRQEHHHYTSTWIAPKRR